MEQIIQAPNWPMNNWRNYPVRMTKYWIETPNEDINYCVAWNHREIKMHNFRCFLYKNFNNNWSKKQLYDLYKKSCSGLYMRGA